MRLRSRRDTQYYLVVCEVLATHCVCEMCYMRAMRVKGSVQVGCWSSVRSGGGDAGKCFPKLRPVSTFLRLVRSFHKTCAKPTEARNCQGSCGISSAVRDILHNPTNMILIHARSRESQPKECRSQWAAESQGQAQSRARRKEVTERKKTAATARASAQPVRKETCARPT